MLDNKKVSLKEVLVYTRSMIADVLQIEENEIRLDTSFMKELGADSLDMLDILYKLETKFNITFKAVDSREMLYIPVKDRNQYFVYNSDSLTLRTLVSNIIAIIRAREFNQNKQRILKQNLERSGR